ncbi:MAG: hypothetical protein J6T10_04765 [Methanobrevibacter sp.]|nr:hypothetical protein [Methanobrevibacter sp.]
MKKRLGDLTKEEKMQICNENYPYRCATVSCPLKFFLNGICIRDVDFDQEVEVKDHEKTNW